MLSKKLKSFGQDVQEVQKYLNKLGFDCGFADGVFGDKTEKAVNDFQKKNKLVVDGIVGNITNTLMATQYYELILGKGALKLQESEIKAIAKEYKIDCSLVRAVAEIESLNQTGFLDNGQLLMLFESAVFWKALTWNGINPSQYYSQQNMDILTYEWVRNYGPVDDQHRRLSKAIQIDEKSAYESASYGMFQIMGFNFKIAGYGSAKEMIKDFEIGEGRQLKAFFIFITNSGSIDFLRKRDFANFARLYNGAGYAQNGYHWKLKQADEKWGRLS